MAGVSFVGCETFISWRGPVAVGARPVGVSDGLAPKGFGALGRYKSGRFTRRGSQHGRDSAIYKRLLASSDGEVLPIILRNISETL